MEDGECFSYSVVPATKAGNVEFVAKMIGTYPRSIWKNDENGINIFGLAIQNSQVQMFNLIHEIRGWKRLHLGFTNKNGN